MSSQGKRRFFRFSLRSLLIVSTVLYISLGWLAWRVNRARRQETAINLLKADGTLLYRDQFDMFAVAMARWTGRWNYGDVRELVLAHDLYKPLPITFSPQEIDLLRDFPCLKDLEIHSAQCEETIVRLAEVDSLEFVALRMNSANDPGVSKLEALRPDLEVVTK